MRKFITISKRLLVGAIAATLFGGATGCATFMHFPTRYLYYDPAKMNLRFDEVKLPSYDGVQLAGWRFRQKGPGKTKGLIFFAHGNAENISSHFTSLAWVLERGYDFFIFDYRGYGASEGGRPTPREGVGDTIAALRWADGQARKEGLPLFAFGQSMGSILLVRALVEERESIRPRMIVLDSPFLSFQWAGASVLSQHWLTTPFQPLAFLLLSDTWAPGRRIQELSPTPILIFHGDADRVVDYRLGRETYDAALQPKEFVRIPDGAHTRAFWGKNSEKYRDIFISRLDAALKSE